MRNIYFLCAILLLLASCAQSDYRATRPISPESLTKHTIDKVVFSFQAKNFTKDLEDWIAKDVPDRAMISCDKNKVACEKAATVLKKMGISFLLKNHDDLKDDIVIFYDSKERIDCSKIVEGKSNFGCAHSSNIKVMIGE